VLVVEDEENVRYVAAAALRLAGLTVDEVATGREALRELIEPRPVYDLLVLDVMLPDLDGFEVCRRLRSQGVAIPVVFLTARGTTEDRVRGLSIGGDDYLTKPFSVEELVARVRVVLRRTGRSPAAEVLSAGAVELDDDAHLVRVDGRDVALSPTEFKLLRFLLRNPGRALTRAQIIDHVWDYDFAGEPTVIETFVSSLRRKLDPEARLIQTVRGVGYRLRP
jgi:two-component system OmpR family response regulator